MASRRTGRITKGWGEHRRSQYRRPAGSAALERLARSRAAIPGHVSGLAAANGKTDRWWQGDGGRKRLSTRSAAIRSEEHTYALQSLMRISLAVLGLHTTKHNT